MSKWFGKKKGDVDGSMGQFVEAMDQVLERHFPDPQAIADQLATTIEFIQTRFLEQLIKVENDIAKQYETVTDKWEASVDRVEKAVQKMEQTPIELTGSLHSAVDGLKDVVSTLNTTVEQIPEKTAASLEQPGQQLSTQFSELLRTFGEQVSEVKTATETLSAKMEHVAKFSAEIDQLLHVQEAVKTTVDGIAATQSFQDVMGSLRDQISQIGTVLETAAKPRVITLVEEDVETA